MVDPASRRTGRFGEHVHERRRVVVGNELPLGHRRNGEARGADLVELGESRAGHLLARRHLDLTHGLEAGVVGPGISQRRPCVAIDH